MSGATPQIALAVSAPNVSGVLAVSAPTVPGVLAVSAPNVPGVLAVSAPTVPGVLAVSAPTVPGVLAVSAPTVTVALQFLLLGLALLLVALGLAIFVARGWRDVVWARRSAQEDRLRPLMLRLLSEDRPNLEPLNALRASDRRLVEWIAWQLLGKVRGSSREVLVQWLVLQGAVERTRQRTHRGTAVSKARAAEHLGAAGVTSTYPDLVRLLRDRHPDVRIVAARALGKLGDARAVPELLALLQSSRGVPAGIVSMAILHIGPAAVDNLIHALGSRSEAVRRVATDLLGIHGAVSATRWLIALLQHDASLEVRSRSAAALGRIGSPQATEALLRCVSPDMPVELRVPAVRALGLLGGQAALDALSSMVHDPDGSVRTAVVEALGDVGEGGLEVLRRVSSEQGPGSVAAQSQLVRRRLQAERLRHRRRRVGSRQGVA